MPLIHHLLHTCLQASDTPACHAAVLDYYAAVARALERPGSKHEFEARGSCWFKPCIDYYGNASQRRGGPSDWPRTPPYRSPSCEPHTATTHVHIPHRRLHHRHAVGGSRGPRSSAVGVSRLPVSLAADARRAGARGCRSAWRIWRTPRDSRSAQFRTRSGRSRAANSSASSARASPPSRYTVLRPVAPSYRPCPCGVVFGGAWQCDLWDNPHMSVTRRDFARLFALGGSAALFSHPEFAAAQTPAPRAVAVRRPAQRRAVLAIGTRVSS